MSAGAEETGPETFTVLEEGVWVGFGLDTVSGPITDKIDGPPLMEIRGVGVKGKKETPTPIPVPPVAPEEPEAPAEAEPPPPKSTTGVFKGWLLDGLVGYERLTGLVLTTRITGEGSDGPNVLMAVNRYQ